MTSPSSPSTPTNAEEDARGLSPALEPGRGPEAVADRSSRTVDCGCSAPLVTSADVSRCNLSLSTAFGSKCPADVRSHCAATRSPARLFDRASPLPAGGPSLTRRVCDACTAVADADVLSEAATAPLACGRDLSSVPRLLAVVATPDVNGSVRFVVGRL